MAYIDMIGCDVETKDKVTTYMDFIMKRASGELMTPVREKPLFFSLMLYTHNRRSLSKLIRHGVAGNLDPKVCHHPLRLQAGFDCLK